MNAIRFSIFVACVVSVTGLVSSEPERPISIPVQVNPPEAPGQASGAVGIVAPTKVSASAKVPVYYSYQVVNRLPYEVFVEISSADSATLDIEKGPLRFECGERTTAWDRPQRSLLRLLHATEYKDGRPWATCGCARAFAKIKIGLNEGELTDFIGCRGTLQFTLYGYRRSDGAAFEALIKVPIEITK